MSEYQIYEFQAIDRPLTAQEQAELRKYSSRATITSSRHESGRHQSPELRGLVGENQLGLAPAQRRQDVAIIDPRSERAMTH